MSGSIERTILSNLLHNEEYARKVIPFIKSEYFIDKSQGVVAETIVNFFNQYNHIPSLDILGIELSKRPELKNGSIFSAVESFVNELDFTSNDTEWLFKETETFCKKRAVTLAILDSYEIVEGNDKNRTEDAIPSILADALAICFDTSIGHDYLEDFDSRYDFYHRKEEKLPFDLELLNKITKGGLSKKTLNVVMAGTGVGKSMFMCHVAASTLMQSKNVLYLTMEMAEQRIAERIDANLLNMTMSELSTVDRESYHNRIGKLIKKSSGKLIIKEYPQGSAHAGHFKLLLDELKTKRNFTPDLIVIDYLNICASSRIKNGSGANSYTIVKSIAEEIRGLAQECNAPILTATQTTRSGFNSTDVELTDTSESFGTPATADLFLALISSEELENLNQLMIKQLKNRYNDPNYYKRFVVGIDRARMRLYDLEESAQKNLADSGQTKTSAGVADDTPVFDKTSFGQRMKSTGKVATSDFTF